MSPSARPSAESSGAALRLEELEGGIGLVTFDQPGSKANTLGQAVLAELEALVKQLAGRTDLRGLILQSGKPGMFVAGADLRELGNRQLTPELARAIVGRMHGILTALEAVPYPTVAVIDGPCLGGGLELALAFDYRLAGTNPKTELGFPEVKVGIIPAWGGTQRLPRLIGPSLAAEIICGGDSVKAARARELGLVFDVVPSERLLDEARRLLDGPGAGGQS